ncbi:unnamed protein product, partial [Brachionus calyciflorus]
MFSSLNDHDMTSDHLPIQITMSEDPSFNEIKKKNQFNFLKAEWENFRKILLDFPDTRFNGNLDEMCQSITDKILFAANNSIPKYGCKFFKSQLPQYIIDLIKERRQVRRKFQSRRNILDKVEFNRLTGVLRLKLKEHRNKSWFDFLNKIGNKPLNSRPFWKKINRLYSNKDVRSIPTLIRNGKVFKTDEEKAKLFGQILSETFSLNKENSDKKFDEEIFLKLKNYFKWNQNYNNEPISLKELKDAINRTKDFSAAGPDQLHNLMLKNLPTKTLCEIIRLFNLSLILGKVPSKWKIAQITMLPKKNLSSGDPNEYRPISLNSCL